MTRLRLSLTIPGAISLGAYEGGALAALIVAAKAIGEDTMVIDSIASASAGSITGLLTARSLLRSVDPVDLLAAAWVENVSFEAMKTHSTESPLSSAALTEMATKVMGPGGVPEGPPGTWQQEPVVLSMALTSLAGLSYKLAGLAGHTPVAASTFLDWYKVTLTNAAGPDDYLSHAQAAIASGSNAIGFPAKLLNRLADKAQYDDAGLEGFPADGLFWYTDGGTVDNEPLGRTIDLAQGIGSDDERLYLLIHPDPAFPTSSPSTVWGGDAPQPPWVRAGTHAFSISRSQSIYEDLLRLEKTNSRLEWIKKVAPAVLSGLEAGIAAANLPDDQADQLRTSLMTALGDVLREVRGDQVRVASLENRTAPDHGTEVAGDWTDILDTLVHAASGLEKREKIMVEVVSPTVDPAVTESPSEQLAGAFFFHFGGFFDVRFRQSDFALGYRNMSYWMTQYLGSYLPGVDLSAAFVGVDQRYAQLGWDRVRHGGAQLGSLSLGEKLELGHLALHVGHVINHDLIHGGT
ncbi:MAG TPA: patatin-like phospholipase family protein [Acidimicrobiales bacterium]|nr:patatin-like phospholipase family protein [Acidimicrobiales bacterium]